MITDYSLSMVHIIVPFEQQIKLLKDVFSKHISATLQLDVHLGHKFSALKKVFGSPGRNVIKDLPGDESEHAYNVPLLNSVLWTWQHVLHALQGAVLVFNRLLDVV